MDLIKDILSCVLIFCSIGSVAGFLMFAFVVFIVYLRCKLPSGSPKSSVSTTLQVRRVTTFFQIGCHASRQ